jgi:hypothetical protein
MLYNTEQWLLALGALVAVLVAAELGFRLGLRQKPNADEPTRAHFAALQVALLGLLALIVAFTFSIAVGRFDARKDLIIEESNAIGTTYLRARLLAEPQRMEVVALLRAYVDEQLAFYAAGIDPARLDAVNARIADLQEQLWLIAIAASEHDPRSVPTGLFVQSLNGVIDLHAKRIKALENRLPDAVIYLVLIVAVVTIGLVGYGRGLVARRNFVSDAILSGLVVIVFVTILDLDRPRRGLITVSQSSLERVQEVLRRAQP